MAVEKGRNWGESATPPPEALEAHDDAEASSAIGAALAAGSEPPRILLLGGDMFKTLGGSPHRCGSARFGVDLGVVDHDGGRDVFLAHLVARRSWWWGRVTAVMNAEFVGKWEVAPRAHPGDGRFDVVEGDPDIRQRILARSRLRRGDHLPHPDITTRRIDRLELSFGSPTSLWLDGRRTCRTGACVVTVIPDRVEVYI